MGDIREIAKSELSYPERNHQSSNSFKFMSKSAKFSQILEHRSHLVDHYRLKYSSNYYLNKILSKLYSFGFRSQSIFMILSFNPST